MHATLALNMVGMDRHKRPLGGFEPMRVIEYNALIERGVLGEARVELLDGELVAMSPQQVRHASVVEQLTARLYRQLGADLRIRCQLPMVLGALSSPEPDLVVSSHGATLDHPTTAYLVVEVTDSTRDNDERKIGIYARANLPVYWLFDLVHRVVRVHTHPDPVLGVYRSVTLHHRGDVLRLASLPALAVELADLLA